MLLSNRVAIITGGAKGIGRSIALKFAGEGCSVAIADISIKEGDQTVEEILKKGSKGLAIQCDVKDGRQVKAAVEKVIGEFGQVDILVNNAGGISASTPIEDLTEEQWDAVMALNLKSNFLFCKAVIPYMKAKRYGKIINISSIGAINPPKHAIHYNSAKAGVLGFTYDLAGAVAAFNINVNAIMPGLTQTAFYDQLIGPASEEKKAAFFAGLGKAIPMGRVGTPDDMSGTALFLASELSDYVTGTSVLVAGGAPLTPQNAPR